MKEFVKKYSCLLALILLALIAFGLSFVNPFEKLDYRLYDFMLSKTKEINESPDIVFVDIDDESLAKVGTWPWTRDILGDVLIHLKEFNAKLAIFDIEYVSSATNSVEDDLALKINDNFMQGQESIANSVLEYAEKINLGKIAPKNAITAAEYLVDDLSNGILYEMQRDITSNFNRDNDDYFARTVQFFGNVSLTVNVRDIGIKRDKDEIKYVQDRFLFGNVIDEKKYFQSDNFYSAREEGENISQDFVPAIHKIVSRANGVGFPNVVIDKDGVRRRIELFNYHDGKFAGQLAFAPFVKMCDAKSFVRKKHSLTISDILLPGETNRCNIKIPLDSHGRMLINWLHKGYGDSFVHVPAYLLYNLEQAERLIETKLSEMAKIDFSNLSEEDASYLAEGFDYFSGEYASIKDEKQKLLLKCRGFDNENNAIRGGISDDGYNSYFEMRTNFFGELKEFAESFSTINDSDKIAGILDFEQIVSMFMRDYERIAQNFKNALVLFGNSATSSTDLGSTPFVKRYANLGTHANVLNTIMNRNFIREIPVLWGVFLCFVISFLVMIVTKPFSKGKQSLFAIIYVVLPIVIFFVLMTTFKIYIPPVLPLLFGAILPFVIEVILNFRELNGQKKFLQTKMGAYVSPEVVKEMQKNPQLAELGAQNRYMTALFSDVATFSGFTETLNNALGEEKGAVKLQEILSDYLGYLTKAIMGQSGTVDKFVGDEIVSFFNAPLDDENHAFHACVAGIRMLQAEAEYNKLHESELPINVATGKPFLLHSRVGMNTGYMAVGNMGTHEKMNYTVMGNAVNLASRLEGTNKVYGSWIMCSDSTWQSADAGENKGKLIARKFDCVRVINVKKPVQIHNILGLRDELPKEQIDAAQIFNEGMDWYLKGSDTPNTPKSADELKKAYSFFKKADELFPADASSKFFMKRCVDFLRDGIPPVWDGVFTMTQK